MSIDLLFYGEGDVNDDRMTTTFFYFNFKFVCFETKTEIDKTFDLIRG